jgi:mannitol/fructose-specific phosphotransferase system IIA component (Ntr-type)
MVEVNDWEEAIRRGAGILLMLNKNEKRYIDNIINMVKKLGPYMAICYQPLLSHSQT